MKRKWKYNKYIRKQINSFHIFTLNKHISSKTTPDHNLFFNLTTYNLDEFKPLFNNGLKHIPHPIDTNLSEIRYSIERFTSTIGWKHFFESRKKPLNNNFDPRFKTDGKEFHFKFPYDKALRVREQLYEEAGNIFEVTTKKSKFSLIDYLLHKLSKMKDITIVAADKNLGFVALPITHYDLMMKKHLTDTTTYTEIEPMRKDLFFTAAFIRTRPAYSELVQLISFHTIISEQQRKYLRHFDQPHKAKLFKLPLFHGLPKLHKNSKILETRPIVAAVSWFTTPVSKVLSDIIRPYSLSPFILKDSLDFVRSLSNLRNANELNSTSGFTFDRPPLLVTIDVKALYTNINLLDLQREITKIDEGGIMELMFIFICNHNYFTYFDTIYKQISGISMGTNCAPELANLYLKQVLDPEFINHNNITNYKRYLDDIFFLWHGSNSELRYLLAKLNEDYGRMKFTIESSKTKISFLDVDILLSSNGRQLHWSTHQKSINKYAYIKQNSSHPQYIFRGFIKTELERYRRNSSSIHAFQIIKHRFFIRLLKRNYKRNFITKIFDEIPFYKPRPPKSGWFTNKPTKNSTDWRDTTPNNPVIMVLRYTNNPFLKKFRSDSIKLAHIHMDRHFERKLILRPSWKRSKNLGDILIHSSFNSSQRDHLKESLPMRTPSLNPQRPRNPMLLKPLPRDPTTLEWWEKT